MEDKLLYMKIRWVEDKLCLCKCSLMWPISIRDVFVFDKGYIKIDSCIRQDQPIVWARQHIRKLKIYDPMWYDLYCTKYKSLLILNLA
jgi:hypothetical protein